MTTSLPTPKKAVALIEAAFKDRKSDIVTKEAYHLLAQLWGYKDWATASAMLKQQTTSKSEPNGPGAVCPSAVKDWPVWVFCNQGHGEDMPMYVYPYGTRLDQLYANRNHWHLINDAKTYCMEVPSGLLRREDMPLVVGEEIACAYPDSEQYGIPGCASEAGAPGFLHEELGFSHLSTEGGTSLVEVTSTCRGDDGGTEWWVQVRVHPDVHMRLSQVFTPARVAFEHALLTRTTPELLDPAQDVLWAAARIELALFSKSWFQTPGSWTLDQVLERLCGHRAEDMAETALAPGYLLLPTRKHATVAELCKALETALKDARALLNAA